MSEKRVSRKESYVIQQESKIDCRGYIRIYTIAGV